MEEAETVEVVADLGLAGCAHARKGGSRQVLLVDKETLDAMELHPGIIRENITTQGLNVNGLEMGQRLNSARRSSNKTTVASRCCGVATALPLGDSCPVLPVPLARREVLSIGSRALLRKFP